MRKLNVYGFFFVFTVFVIVLCLVVLFCLPVTIDSGAVPTLVNGITTSMSIIIGLGATVIGIVFHDSTEKGDSEAKRAYIYSLSLFILLLIYPWGSYIALANSDFVFAFRYSLDGYLVALFGLITVYFYTARRWNFGKAEKSKEIEPDESELDKPELNENRPPDQISARSNGTEPENRELCASLRVEYDNICRYRLEWARTSHNYGWIAIPASVTIPAVVLGYVLQQPQNRLAMIPSFMVGWTLLFLWRYVGHQIDNQIRLLYTRVVEIEEILGIKFTRMWLQQQWKLDHLPTRKEVIDRTARKLDFSRGHGVLDLFTVSYFVATLIVILVWCI